MAACPRCHSEVQPDWDWCQVCGYDPEGRKPPEPDWRDLPPPRLGDRPEWGAPIGETAGYAPGVGAPQWGTPPTGPGLVTNGNGHAHAYGPPPRPPRSTGTIVLLVIAGIVVGGLLLLGVLVLAVTLLGRNAMVATGPTGATVPPGAATFVAPNGSFGADFPVTPSAGPAPPATSGISGGQSWVARTGQGNYVVVVANLVKGESIDTESLFDGERSAFTSNLPGVSLSTTKTTVDGHPAEQISGATSTGVLRGETVVTPAAVYVILAAGPASSASSLESFTSSLQLPG